MAETPRLFVACLCAAWCGVCGEYRARFEAAKARWPDLDFTWIDIEDEADVLEPVEVENFPTILIARGAQPLFFGPITPQPETLDRLLRSYVEGAGAAPVEPGVAALLQRLAR